MKTFIHDDFLLHTEVARTLYHEYAAPLPIYDYHCHLPPEDVAQNKRFDNLYDIWLAGDHYKWRAMRSNGISEELCTGSASPRDKYNAFVKTVPATLRNPMYHWCHLELKRYFGMDLLISPDTADDIWEQAQEKLAAPEFSARGILAKMNVKIVCTTDDPALPLTHHQAISQANLPTRVYPTFRPDKAYGLNDPKEWKAWLAQLSATSNISIQNFEQFQQALETRHNHFHAVGCRLSDHGLSYAYDHPCSRDKAESLFAEALMGNSVSPEDRESFAAYLMHFFAELGAHKGWTMQLHLGPIRNNRSQLLRTVGPDAGTDSIGDFPQAQKLSSFLDQLDRAGHLPKTILYNINPADNYLMATMIGNFQDGTVPGKMQFGSGWWFLDQKEGMEMQINALSACGLLSRFVGMTTDSRSFLSYTRHEYFRRILCNLIGGDVVRGELPQDLAMLGKLVENVCYYNAVGYFGLEMP